MSDIYIAIDFDGTLVHHDFPRIGEEVPHAIRVLKQLQENPRVKLILHTMRSDQGQPYLKEAVAWCESRGIRLFGANKNHTQHSWTLSPKTYAHIYIDDAALGCPLVPSKGGRPYVDWLAVEKLLNLEHLFIEKIHAHESSPD